MNAKLVKESLNDEPIERLRSKGEKTDAILQYIADAGPEGRRFDDIVKFAYEYSNGENSYDKKQHRGYWGNAFRKPSPFRGGVGHLMYYITKNENGLWVLRDEKITKEEIQFFEKEAGFGESGR